MVSHTDTDLHVVFGATGQVDTLIVRELAAQGKRVRAVNRFGVADVPAGVEVVQADATNRDQVIAAAAGARVVYHAKAATLPTALLQLAGLFNVAARESAKMAYEFAYPYVMDGSKFTRTFGGQPTPHREAIRQTLAWFRQRAAQPSVPRTRKATA